MASKILPFPSSQRGTGEADDQVLRPHDDIDQGMACLGLSSLAMDPLVLAFDMQKRCRLMLEEVEEFQAYLKEQKRPNVVELRIFKNNLQAELKILDKVHGHTR